MKPLVYLFGMLALAHTDFGDPRPLFSFWLPLLDFFFLAFLWCELLLYFSLFNFAGDGRNVYATLQEVVDIREAAERDGWLAASYALATSLLDALLLFTALILAAAKMIELATIS